MRKAPALLLSAGLLMATLTGCAPTSAADACVPTAPDGAASKLIDVSGSFGSAPTVEFPTPVKAQETERTVVIPGDDDGPVLTAAQSIRMSLAMFDGATGDPIPGATYGEPAVYSTAQLNPEITKALECVTPGSRIAMTVPQGNQAAILVADIFDVFLAKANGADRPVLQSGLPSVVTAADGTPGLTIPKSDPPKDLAVAVLKAGDGDTVSETSQMVVHYTGALWKERTIFDSSWQNGSPATFSPDGIIPGLATALTGQKVGSQVLVVIPPELGYGDQDNATIPANSTLVFVVDILGTLP
ncbi:FKBP-type peptidyl-prolyl cis-trans isomerase [Mycetocola miduiensis]|uniref:Peptidyl-prolyl cis-trans isomerase n=1 Tax=Mycetocola miduiensis TaxID=995034 RepID=A0A1I5A6F3_9MICO|nr:FKBP-type peptidyl-prolyl cis-trans isomerase [Mycetocola miduiensis]SFN58033.1 FKBP-type peptidyl-prolyl cis-trans isomerase [Mycetocola miduiensis]